jgi:DNA-binding CsgD family transcriptional regulator
VDFGEPGKLRIDSASFSILNGRMVQDYENISRINENLSLISIDDGFALFNRLLKPQKQTIPAVFIGKVENITTSDSVITESGSLSGPVRIKYNRNNIRINYALPYYRQASITYQYFLEGYSKDWSPWSEVSQKDFTNLPYGNYSFRVRAKINDGAVSETSTFEFEVMPPLTATVWAWILYVILLIVALYFTRRWYFKKLQKHQLKIEKQVQQEKEDHLKQEAIINEQKLIKLKNEKLQAEIDSKSREVTNSAMNIVYKNDFLQRIKEELTHLKDADGKKLNDDQLRRMHKIIDEGMNKERDWNLFESSFNETHESFFKKLKTQHPDLVPNDLKLCAYLRMNMNSKEMASLLNISLRGVEIRRYRLRKKLDIPHDKNLVEFLIEL